MNLTLELESFDGNVAVFSAVEPRVGRVALEMRVGLWRKLGHRAMVQVTLDEPQMLTPE